MTAPVVLGVPDADRARQLAAKLDETGEFAVAGEAATSAELLELLTRTEALAVVVDEGIGPVTALDLVREIGAAFPQVAVVLVARDPSPDAYAAAMQAGARGLLPLDPTLEEIEGRLGPAVAWARTVRRHLAVGTGDELPLGHGTMVVVAGAKGGTGTTTVAVHTALLAASSAGKRVCLVDMDLQSGDVVHLLEIAHRRSVVDLVEVADDLTPSLLQDALFLHSSGLHVLLAPAEGERGEDVTTRAARRILSALKTRFDVVVVDAGTVMTAAGTAAVEMADKVLLTVTPDVLALRAAKRQIRLWDRLQALKSDDVVVVLNQTSRSSDVQPDVAKRVIKAPMAATALPADYKALQPAINTGDPALLADGPLRRALVDLVAELGLLTTPPPANGRRRGGRRARVKVRADEGQATIETVALFPLIVLVVALLWQFALVGFTFVLAGQSAEAGAQAYSVGAPASVAVDEARADLPSAWRDGFSAGASGRSFEVAVRVPVLLPGLGSAFTIRSAAGLVPEP